MEKLDNENIIEQKSEVKSLTGEEIYFFMGSIMKSMKTEQESKKAEKAVCSMVTTMFKKGLDETETKHFVESMHISSFNQWPEEWIHFFIDTNSISGVDDKITFILAPALSAALHLNVLVIFRKYTSPSGITCKLEWIPGFRVVYNQNEMCNILRATGCCVVGENEYFGPSKEVLNHFKDIMPDDNYPPLMVASVLWKLRCEEIRGGVFNVKYGRRSIFIDKKEAEEAAKNFMESKRFKVSAILVSTEITLGEAVSERMEIHEVINCLKGKGPSDLVQLATELGSEILQIIRGTTKEEGIDIILNVIRNGSALQKFKELIIQQGVSEEIAQQRCAAKKQKPGSK